MSLDLHPELARLVAGEVGGQCREALKLTAEHKHDPPEEPYRSLYAARECWSGVRAALEACPQPLRQEDWALLWASVALQRGLNYMLAEEVGRGEEELGRGLQVVVGVASKVKSASVSVQLYNQLALVWGNRGDQQKALEYLLKAKAVYESHVALPPPLTETEWLSGQPASKAEREATFEGLHTLTLFYLAQVYGNLEQAKLSAQCCQATLSRQLEAGEYDALEWSLNCATLSQYYLNTDHFPQARHCLACASAMLERLCAEEEEEGAKEKVEQARADVSRCWAKYCLALLRSSLDKLQGAEQETRPQRLFRFDTLEVVSLEEEVPCETVEGFEGAKRLFLTGQRHLNSAKHLYSLNDFASDHVSLVQDHSQLFKLLAAFESDEGVRCRMLKRRADMLSAVLEELNPQHFLLISRQLLYELGEVYSDLSAIKIVLASDSPSPQAVGKVNRLLRQGLRCYERFTASFADQEGRQPQEYEESWLRPLLCARLHSAQLLGKLISPDMPTQVGVAWGQGWCTTWGRQRMCAV